MAAEAGKNNNKGGNGGRTSVLQEVKLHDSYTKENYRSFKMKKVYLLDA